MPSFDKIQDYISTAFKIAAVVLATVYAYGRTVERSDAALTGVQSDLIALKAQVASQAQKQDTSERSILLIHQGFQDMKDTLKEIKDELKEQRKK